MGNYGCTSLRVAKIHIFFDIMEFFCKKILRFLAKK